MIDEMLKSDKPVLLDVVVSDENCLPMVPSGAPHYEMILGDEDEGDSRAEVTDDGLALV
jgi:acetolactate synthase-1/2/3 large subunit